MTGFMFNIFSKASQRLVAITFLYDMYKSDAVSNNPFSPVFVQLLGPTETFDPGEQR